MRKISFSRRASFWAAVALFAVAAPCAPLAQAASHSANLELLTAQLPNGVTPGMAKVKELSVAVHAASAKRPADAADIVRIALVAKKAKRRELTCIQVRAIVDAAISAAPEKTREIVEMAQSLEPNCSEDLDRSLNGGGANGNAPGAAVPGSNNSTDGGGTADGGSGFNNGFGAGFPGSPGFGGSAPSGGFALPTPVPTPVTSSVNT